VLSVAGCGGGDTSDAETSGAEASEVDASGADTADADVAAYDPEGAASCEELASMYVGSTARFLAALGTRTDEDMAGDIPADVLAAADEIAEWDFGSAMERISELCTDMEEFEEFVCQDAPSLEAQGEAAERHLREDFARCD
jgi:hypothetical protein